MKVSIPDHMMPIIQRALANEIERYEERASKAHARGADNSARKFGERCFQIEKLQRSMKREASAEGNTAAFAQVEEENFLREFGALVAREDVLSEPQRMSMLALACTTLTALDTVVDSESYARRFRVVLAAHDDARDEFTGAHGEG